MSTNQMSWSFLTGILLFFVLLNTVTTISFAQTWTPVGAEGFSESEAFSQSIAFIGETPYVAYMDRANDDKATVMKFTGEAWEAVGNAGFTPGKARSLSFAVSETTPYVAFSDEANGRKASVMKFDGTGWVFVGGAGFTENIADEVSLAIDGGTLWLAFQDAANGSKITVMKNGGEGWAVVGSPGFSTGFMTNVIDLAVENGIPYVSYRDYSASYRASVMKYSSESSAWEVLGEQGFSASMHDAYQCLAVHSGTPYLSARGTNAKATLYKFDGSNWSPLGTDGLSAGTAFYPTVKFDKNGVPHIAFSDDGEGGKAVLMKYTETGWVKIGEVASESRVDYPSLAFSGSGIPYLAFRDHWRLRRTTVMKFASVTNAEITSDEKELLVWPNPGNGKFNLKLPGIGNNQFQVQVIDSSGKIIYSQSINSGQTKQLDLSGNKNGMYWIKATNGEQTFTTAFQINQ